MWVPNAADLLLLYNRMKLFPENHDLVDGKLMSIDGLKGTADMIKYGIPCKPTDFWERTAILFRDLVSNHYFTDGNKRIATLAVNIFLEKNGYRIPYNLEEEERFCLSVAQGRDDLTEIGDWFETHAIKK